MSELFRLIAPKAGYGYIRYSISGLKELDTRLSELGPKIAKKIGNRATRLGASVIRDEARRNAPVKSSLMKDNIIYFRPRRHKKTGYQEVTNAMHIGVRLKGKGATKDVKRRVKGLLTGRSGYILKKYPAYYWFMVEYGTRKQPAQRFLRNAFDAQSGKARDIMIAELRKGIEKEAGKKG